MMSLFICFVVEWVLKEICIIKICSEPGLFHHTDSTQFTPSRVLARIKQPVAVRSVQLKSSLILMNLQKVRLKRLFYLACQKLGTTPSQYAQKSEIFGTLKIFDFHRTGGLLAPPVLGSLTFFPFEHTTSLLTDGSFFLFLDEWYVQSIKINIYIDNNPLYLI
jgi:hypothetical protein